MSEQHRHPHAQDEETSSTGEEQAQTARTKGLSEAVELGFIPDVRKLIKVQDEATVSRTIMQQQGGNVVLFSFDAGQELSEHTAAMPVFVQTISGHIEVTGSGETVDLFPGGLVYFPTRLPHAVKAVEPSIMMLTMITPARAAAKTQ
ncbi:MAG: cupin domain-containing protein [Bifidobacterium crudilactis]|jgi:quercetin dioxygenase-like cupin family protein